MGSEREQEFAETSDQGNEQLDRRFAEHSLVPGHSWKVLVVDDDTDVHEATEFTLSKVKILGRPLKLLHALNAEEALNYLKLVPNVAVILLDVVMESPDTGLRLVKEFRALGFREPRIILRTGYPGLAPENRVIQDYEVDDYWSKDELTRSRLITSLTTAIRAYDYIRTLSATRAGLEMVIDGTRQLFGNKDLDLFTEGVLRQIAAILHLRPEGAICAMGSSETNAENMVVMSGVGRFAGHVGECIAALTDIDHELISLCESRYNEPVIHGARIGLRHKSATGRELLVYFEHNGDLTDHSLVLLKVFSSNLAICFENLALINQLGELAFHDQRLGVPNQNAFDRELFGLNNTDAEQSVVAMLSIEDAPDLAVAFGVSMSDALMLAVYERLDRVTEEGVLVARVGEFVFGVVDASGNLETSSLEKVFDEPFDVMGNRITVKATIGVVRGNLRDRKSSEIQRAARITLLKQEQTAPGGTSEFRSEMADEVENAMRIRGDLQDALKAREISFVFQPKINLSTGAVIASEALCRWQQDGKNVSPAIFIPIAERAGLSADIAFQCLDSVVEMRQVLKTHGFSQMRVAVNLAASDVSNVEFIQELIRQCHNRGLGSDAVSFEITESHVFTSEDDATMALRMLADNDYKIWLDDFGTGYSSLSHLNLLPVSGIKIDQSFVKNLTIERARGSVAASAAAIAENLGLKVVAEGVETREQHQIARFLGIDEVQGFFYSPGLTPQEFIEWYKGWNLDETLRDD
jgi:EAL domain-containing protein (putative c-di-GMP-specific phosphodiesterase class I)/PleD family two-component response regulator